MKYIGIPLAIAALTLSFMASADGTSASAQSIQSDEPVPAYVEAGDQYGADTAYVEAGDQYGADTAVVSPIDAPDAVPLVFTPPDIFNVASSVSSNTSRWDTSLACAAQTASAGAISFSVR
jgi:hypothetical protein